MSSIYTIQPSIAHSATISVTGSNTLSSTLGNITLSSPSNISPGYITVTGSNGMSYDDLQPKSLLVKGQAKFENDIEVKGQITVDGIDLAAAIRRIEERLNLLEPNKALEAEWGELRELGERYRQMERDMLEKLELVEILKKKT